MDVFCCSQPESRASSSTSGSASACRCCEAVKDALCCCCPKEHSHHREGGSSDFSDFISTLFSCCGSRATSEIEEIPTTSMPGSSPPLILGGLPEAFGCCSEEHSPHREGGSSNFSDFISTLFSCCGSRATSEIEEIPTTSTHSKQGEQLATWRLNELNKIKCASKHESIELGPFIQRTQSRIDECEVKSYDPRDPDQYKRLQARKKQLDYLNNMVSSRGWTIVGVLGFHSKATSKNVPTHLNVSEVDSVIVKIGTKLVLISLYSNVENYERHHTKLTKKEFENCYLLPILPLSSEDMGPEDIDQISKHGVLYLNEASVPVLSRQIADVKRSIRSGESLPTDHNTSDTDQCFLIYNDNGNDQFWMTLDANKHLKNAQEFFPEVLV